MRVQMMSLAAAVMLLASAPFALAQQSYQSAPLNVDGYIADPSNVTDRELEFIRNELTKQRNQIQLNREKTKGYRELKRTTEKLADETEEYLDEKNNSQEIIDEYNQRIQCLMGQNADPKKCRKYSKRELDQVKETKAGVEKIQKEIKKEKKKENFGQIVRIIPNVGVSSFMSEDLGAVSSSIESNFSGGIKAESFVSPRISVGLGLRFTSLRTMDLNAAPFYNNFAANPIAGAQGFNPYFNAYQQAFPQFGAGFGGVNLREIQYNQFGIGLYGKYFLVRGPKFQVYAGLGLNYGRNRLEYTGQGNPQFPGALQPFGFGQEEYVVNNLNADISVGSEFMFSEMFGIDAALNYGRSITDFGNQAGVGFNNFDQLRLRELGDQIVNANVLSFYLGAVISF